MTQTNSLCLLKSSKSNEDSDVSSLILWLFGLIEVIMYDCGVPALQFVFAVICYLWILINFLINTRSGIIYFFSFNILALGIFNFWGKTDIISYWGLRLGGLSFNILFTVFLVGIVVMKKKGKHLLPSDKYSVFLYAFYFISLVTGISFSLLGNVFRDNLFSDILTFTPIIFYAILIKDLCRKDLLFIVKKMFSITIFALILAFLLNKKFEYSQELFIVGNTMSFLSPIGALILWKYYPKKDMFFYLVSILFLIGMEAYFACGKTIIMIAIIIIWLLSLNKKVKYLGLFTLFILFPLIINYLDYIAAQLDNKILAFKITQVTQVFMNPQLFSLAAEYSSMGNLIAEGMTLLQYYIENPCMLLTGQGMGAGIPDYFGFLEPFAGRAGYAEIDAARDNYFNLHIAPYKVLANGGLVLFVWYCKLLWDLFSRKTSIAFLAFLMLFLMFYVSKEFLLLTYCLLQLVAKNVDIKQTQKRK